jgi:two-component system sensor histidine kinase PilS (NtrC family)
MLHAAAIPEADSAGGLEPGGAEALGDGAATRTQWKSLRFFAVSRVVLATVLVLLATLDNFGLFSGVLEARGWFASIALAYFLIGSILLTAAFVRRAFLPQLVVQVHVDLVSLMLLMHTAGGARSGMGVLVVAAVAGASVLASHRFSAFFAATATLLLLGEAGWRALVVEPGDLGVFVSAGMIGAACFLTAELVNRLATRLGAQQALALQRGLDLARQLAVNDLVMTQLPQGVVVLDARARVTTMNRSAQAMLGGPASREGLERLARRMLASGSGAGLEGIGVGYGIAQEREVVVDARDLAALGNVAAVSDEGPGMHDRSEAATGSGPDLASGPREIRPRRFRVRLLRPAGGAPAAAVLVVEDQREVEERAQQLKLASMGRLSASIAHEIRNPLAAIRHANALLAEQLTAPAARRLAGIVEDNTLRIDRIVRDVLSVARRDPPTLENVDVARFFAEVAPELARMSAQAPGRVRLSAGEPAPLSFDPGQLRQVLFNLVGNALRYASQRTGAVLVEWRRGRSGRPELRVCDDGPGLAGDILEHAFEPFFTTGARGTGLGLHLAREICLRNRAELRYEPEEDESGCRSVFVIRPFESPDQPGRSP